MAIAALTDVEVDYPRGRALGPLSLSIGAGEIVALVGPSGCGKSTAMRLQAGQQAHGGGLAAAGRADQGHDLARPDAQRERPQRPAPRIVDLDVSERSDHRSPP
jgi:ABC-type nitrate/sulfonate/bicarbonate transport system ATPase subunit